MSYNWEQIYKTFDEVKTAEEYKEYINEMQCISNLLQSPILETEKASQLVSYLAGKYEDEINNEPPQFGIKRTVVKTNQAAMKPSSDLRNDLIFFQQHIPVYALKRETKSEVLKFLLGI